MNILRKILVGVFGGILSLSLVLLAWASIGLGTIHRREVVKSWFDKSDFYNKIVDITLNSFASEKTSNNSTSLPISDPAINKVAKDAISPSFLKTSVETTLDSTYAWLDGSQEELSFNIDLTPVKDQLVKGLTEYAVARAKTLPGCGVIGENSPVDPFVATCLPKAVSPAQVGILAEKNVLDQGFLKDPALTASNLKLKDKNGNEIPLTSDKRIQAVKTTYKLGSILPYVLGGLSIFLAMAMVLLSKGRARGLKRVSSILIAAGLSLAILYVMTRLTFNWASSKLLTAPGAQPTLQERLVLDFVKAALGDIEKVLLLFPIVYLLLGVFMKIIPFVRNKRHKSEITEEQVAEKEPTVPAEQPSHLTTKPAEMASNPVKIAPTAPKLPKKIQG